MSPRRTTRLTLLPTHTINDAESASLCARWRGKVALVTGASAGIGWAACEALAGAGMRVVAIARRRERLEALQQHLVSRGVPIADFLPVVCDITKVRRQRCVLQWPFDCPNSAKKQVHRQASAAQDTVCLTANQHTNMPISASTGLKLPTSMAAWTARTLSSAIRLYLCLYQTSSWPRA